MAGKKVDCHVPGPRDCRVRPASNLLATSRCDSCDYVTVKIYPAAHAPTIGATDTGQHPNGCCLMCIGNGQAGHMRIAEIEETAPP